MRYAGMISRWLKRRKTESSNSKRINYPVRDWLIGLGIFVAIILSGGAYSAHVFLTYRDVSALQSGSAASPEKTTYNENTVKEALTIFREKKAVFEGFEKARVSEIPNTEAVESDSATSSAPEEEGGAHLE